MGQVVKLGLSHGLVSILIGPLGLFTAAFVASSLGAYPIYRLLLAMKSRQTVSQYAPEGHRQKQGTPTMGGLIVVFGVVTAWLVDRFALSLAPASVDGYLFRKPAFIVLFLGFTLIGFTDDYIVPRLIKGKRGLGWKQKILMQLVVACAAAAMLGLGASEMAAITVFDILFFSNAYNFSDGLDALAGVLLLAFGAALALMSNAGPVMALLGAILPFLYYNRPRARLFMGDVGSLPIGAFLGLTVAILSMRSAFRSGSHFGYGASPYGSSPLFSEWSLCLALCVASGMMVVELVPVPLQILSVKLRKKKLFSFTPIHHAFERKGWPEQKVVLAFGLCQVGLSLVALAIFFGGAGK